MGNVSEDRRQKRMVDGSLSPINQMDRYSRFGYYLKIPIALVLGSV